ncbi:TPA: restriction endonuclease subunit S [Providencia rettgeri]|uniref:restriction endonuclease subunit S n=1 Tax=Providencia sp. PROV215 TaxID=2949911 RepID=UPI00234B47AB|nr:restriction endonuclease subunit S [Providencia sp. PROV215]
MAGRYKAYPEYKESGCEIIKVIPQHWICSPLKRNFKIVNGSTPKSEENSFWEGNITWVTPGDLSKISVIISDSVKKITEEGLNSCGTSLVPQGSLILSTRAPIGTIAIAGKELCTNQGCKSLVSKNRVQNKYFYYVIANSGKQLNNLGKGTTFLELSSDELANYYVPEPSYEEQQQIVNFLDYETAKIDTLIAKQEKLIELLKEKRQAVISHVVTKGLNPDVSMKDSGVEWLGEVPEHWVVSKLKFESEIIDCRNKTPEYHSEGEYFVVRTTNVKNQQLNFNGALYTDEKNFKIWTQRGIPPVGSILFTREAPTGEVCRVPNNLKFCMGQRMMNFIAKDKLYADYLFDYLISDCLERYIGSVSHGSTVSHLRVEQVENIPVLVPSRDEIISIHNEISKLKLSYDALVSKVASTIELLKERKTALISAAVTGKIDVRDWQELIEKQG